jgi:hypothetical protein
MKMIVSSCIGISMAFDYTLRAFVGGPLGALIASVAFQVTEI